MYLNRDEFLLLSRQGRVPRAMRTRPPTSTPSSAAGRRPRVGTRGVAPGALMRAVRPALRDRARGRRRLDIDAYRAMEFPPDEAVSSGSRSGGHPDR
jgi:hypothetical protein